MALNKINQNLYDHKIHGPILKSVAPSFRQVPANAIGDSGSNQNWFECDVAIIDAAALDSVANARSVLADLGKDEQTLQTIGNDELLAEVSRRGLLTELHGAVGALYDNLATNGVLDSESNTTSYLAYRLRREDAKLGEPNGQNRSAQYWQQKIDTMDADGDVSKVRGPRP